MPWVQFITQILKLQGKSVDSINRDINIKGQIYFNKNLLNEWKGDFDKTVQFIRDVVYNHNKPYFKDKDY